MGLYEADTVVLKGSRLRWTVLFLASGVFAATGILIFFAAPGGKGGGAVVFAFFGVCAGVGLVQLIGGSSLVLSEDGFTVGSFGRRFTRRWDSVGTFYVMRPTMLTSMVAFRPQTGIGMGALPDTYGMKAIELATLMNEWRARYADS